MSYSRGVLKLFGYGVAALAVSLLVHHLMADPGDVRAYLMIAVIAGWLAWSARRKRAPRRQPWMKETPRHG
jgi:hypothetical protein